MSLEQHNRTDISRTDGFFVSSSLETMFWRPRFLVDSPAMLHVPFLFWLVAAETPRRLAVCGGQDGAVFFALCQALDKQNVFAQCQLFGGWKDSKGEALLTSAPKPLRDHAAQIYDDIAELVPAVEVGDAFDLIRPGSLDLLFVDLDRDPGTDPDTWLACLNETGVLLLHGTKARQRDQHKKLERFLDDKPKIEFQAGSGLTIVLKQGPRSARLQTLLSICSDGIVPGEIALFFNRLGQGMHLAGVEAETTIQLAKVRTSLKQAQEKQAQSEEEVSSMRALLDERGRKLSELQTFSFDAEQSLLKSEATQSELQARLEAVQAEKAALEEAQALRFDEIAALTRKLEALQLEKTTMEEAQTELTLSLDALRKDKTELEKKHAEELRRHEEAQATRFDEIAALTKQLSASQSDKAALEKAHAEDMKRAEKAQAKLKASLKAAQDEQAELRAAQAQEKQRSEEAQAARFEETAELTRQLEKMRAQLDEKDVAFSALEAEKSSLSQRLENLEAVQRTTKEDLERLQSENRALQDHNDALLNSTSWRVTSPLRKIRRGLSE